MLTIDRDGEVTAAFVLEVQLAVDLDKRFTWPLHAAAVHSRFRCPTTLMVLTASAAVARWARGPFESFGVGAWAPRVFGPKEVPRITSLDEAQRAPALAVRSAIVHSREPDAASTLQATVRALAALDPDTRARYASILRTLFKRAASAVPFEALMNQAERWAFIQDLERRQRIAREWRIFRTEASPEEVRRLEPAIWQEAGTEIALQDTQELLLDILSDRGLGPSDAARTRIAVEDDLATLKLWVRRAATAPTEEAVLATV